MKLYRKYIFFEALIACGGSILLFVAVLLIGNAMRDIVDWMAAGRLTFWDTCKILAILVPSVVSYALPLGIMTGTLIVIGRMSSQNEIVAMKSVGISLHDIALPVFSLAGMAVFAAMYINLYYAPDSITKYRMSFRKIVQEKPMSFIVPKTFNDYFKGYVVYVDMLINDEFRDMKVWQFDDAGHIDTYLTAKSGTIHYNNDEGMFVLNLHDGNAEHFNAKSSVNNDGQKVPHMMSFQNIAINLPAKDIIGEQAIAKKKYRHMTLSELLLSKDQLNKNVSNLEYQEIRHQKTLINMQISSSVASAVGIVLMALLAVPLGLKSNRADKAFNVGIAMFLCFSYYFVMVMFSWLGDATRLRPDLMIWMPNIVLGVTGICLFRRALQN